jgi:hypothetical protein
VDGISQKAVDNGFLNRILFVQSSEANPINRFAKKDVPATLVESIRALLNSPPGAMQYEEGAHDFMVSCVDHMHEPGLFKNLWTRAEEQMIRVAGLLALGDGGVIKKDQWHGPVSTLHGASSPLASFSVRTWPKHPFKRLLPKHPS